MSESFGVAKRRSRWGLLLGVGVVLVAANLAFLGWWSGYFKAKEKIALVTWNQDPYWEQVIRGAKDAAADMNVDLTVIQSTPDEPAQTQHVRDLLGKKVMGIGISPNNPTTQEQLLKDVAAQSVLVTFDSDAPTSNRRGFVGSDNYAAGRLCADEIRAAIPDGGEVVLSIGSVDLLNGRDRRQGLIDDLLERHESATHPIDPIDAVLKGSKYSIVATVLDRGDAAKASSLMAEVIKAHPNVKCIAGLFSYSGAAALRAIESAGKTGQVKVVAFDESDATQAGIEAGAISSSIVQDQYRCGYETVTTLAEAIRGINQLGPSGPRLVSMRLMVMNKDNLAALRHDKVVHQPGS